MIPRNSSRVFTLDRSNCCVLVVDMQDKILSATNEHEKILKNAVSFIEISNILSVPTLGIAHCVDKMGEINKELSTALGNAPIYPKETFSIFRTPEIERAVDEMRKDQLIILGIETHICVTQSALDARELGYNVFVLEDACSSIKPEDKASSLKRMRMAGINVLSTQAAAFELLEKAATEEFKKVFSIAKTL